MLIDRRDAQGRGRTGEVARPMGVCRGRDRHAEEPTGNEWIGKRSRISDDGRPATKV